MASTRKEISSASKAIEVLQGIKQARTQKELAEEKLDQFLRKPLVATARNRLNGYTGVDPEVAAASAVKSVIMGLEAGLLPGISNRKQLNALAHTKLRKDKVRSQQREVPTGHRGEVVRPVAVDDPEIHLQLAANVCNPEVRLMSLEYLKLCTLEEQLVAAYRIIGFEGKEIAMAMGVSERKVDGLVAKLRKRGQPKAPRK